MKARRPRPHIVVADDDSAMCELLALSLQPLGDVVRCPGGLALAQTLRDMAAGRLPAADLVVTDVVMPERDGLSALAWCTAHLPSVPVVLITSFGDARMHRRARELGAADVIDKPFALDELRERARRALERRPQSSSGRDRLSSDSSLPWPRAPVSHVAE